MFRLTTVAAVAAALAVPAGAQAHVTLQPKEVTAGGFTRMDVRVPNERDDNGTTKVSVKMPPGFLFVSYEPQEGWTAKITRRKLDKPVEAFGEEVTEEVDTVTFTGSGEQGVIRPGQFKDFGLSVGVPDGKPGTKLTFPSTQTYEGGEVVRWIGAPDAEQPAPVVTLAAGEEAATAHGGAKTSETSAENAQPAAAGSPVSAADLDDKASKTLAIAAIVLGALGMLVGIAGFGAARRSRA